MRQRRAAPARGLAQDGDPPGQAVGRIAAQRILADQVAGQHEVDVRARRPGGQRGAGRVAQVEDHDPLGRPGAGVHDEFEAHRRAADSTAAPSTAATSCPTGWPSSQSHTSTGPSAR